VAPGDSMSASVTFSGTETYTLVLTDSTQDWTQTITENESGLSRSSAEVITEAPSSESGVLPLADFGTVNYGGYTNLLRVAGQVVRLRAAPERSQGPHQQQKRWGPVARNRPGPHGQRRGRPRPSTDPPAGRSSPGTPGSGSRADPKSNRTDVALGR
jgi:hypothetical protein